MTGHLDTDPVFYALVVATIGHAECLTPSYEIEFRVNDVVINEVESHGGFGVDACTRVTRNKVWWTCLDDELDVLVYTQSISRKKIERLAIGAP